MNVSGQHHALAALPRERTEILMEEEDGWVQSELLEEEKIPWLRQDLNPGPSAHNPVSTQTTLSGLLEAVNICNQS